MPRRIPALLACLVCSLAIGCGDDSAGGDGGAGDASQMPADAGVPVADADTTDAGPPTCTFTPTGDFNPALECRWDVPPAGGKYPALDDVVMTPVVINLTDDNADGSVGIEDIPDIAFVAYARQNDTTCPGGPISCGCCNVTGVLRVVSGSCGADGILPEHYAIGATEIEADIGVSGVWLDNSGGLAVGDIDSDGSPDIVATTLRKGPLDGDPVVKGGTIAFERDGTVKWYQPDYPTGEDHLTGTQPSLADIDADGNPEVIQGRVVLNGEDGSLQWGGTDGLGTNGFMGPVSCTGDVDLNGHVDILAGGTRYIPTGVGVWSFTFPVPIDDTNCQHQGYPCDGFTATGNFDADPEGEVVIVRAGIIYIAEHTGAAMEVGGAPVEIAIPIDDCARNEGGPPTVADFDGDGEPEIGVAGADYYIVADLECLASPLPAQCSDPGIRWKVPNFDCSSRTTGSSVFDFDGDGRAEVVYADEQQFRILDGVDGSDRLVIENHSHTRLEMPIVVDVDNDGNAEIVFVENLNGAGATSQGIRVYGDATDSWVATRRVWNQHSYHVTNVSELGEIPSPEPPNWREPTDATLSGFMNSFRQNLPENDAFAAPDLTVGIDFVSDTCTINAKVCNEGDVVVGAGVSVTFWDNATMEQIMCDNDPVQTTVPLPPDACEVVTCLWSEGPNGPADVRACVDNADYTCSEGAPGANNECHEDNNLDDNQTDLACNPIG